MACGLGIQGNGASSRWRQVRPTSTPHFSLTLTHTLSMGSSSLRRCPPPQHFVSAPMLTPLQWIRHWFGCKSSMCGSSQGTDCGGALEQGSDRTGAGEEARVSSRANAEAKIAELEARVNDLRETIVRTRWLVVSREHEATETQRQNEDLLYRLRHSEKSYEMAWEVNVRAHSVLSNLCERGLIPDSVLEEVFNG